MRQSVYLDFFRGISAQMVLVGHSLNIFISGSFMQMGANGMLEASRPIPYMQNLGVVIFFALSGFLITASVVERSKLGYDLASFIADRAARIFTPFIPALILIAICDHLFFNNGDVHLYTDLPLGLSTFLTNMTLLISHPSVLVMQRLTGLDFHAVGFGTADQFWTVAIEWWLYIGFGVMVLLLVKREAMSIWHWALLLFAASVPILQLSSGSGLILAWFVGMMAALAAPTLNKANKLFLAAVCGLSLIISTVILIKTGFYFYHPITVIGISVAFCLGQFLWEPTCKGLASFLSKYSYSLYLVHLPILFYLVEAGLAGWPAVVAGFMVCNVLALVFWCVFERHHKIIRQYIKRSSPSAS
jgi:peptidoglycan/LPS O-acetylase OafA/YrhL